MTYEEAWDLYDQHRAGRHTEPARRCEDCFVEMRAEVEKLRARELELIAGQETLIAERNQALEALRSAENRLVSQRIATEAAIHAANIYRRDAEGYKAAAKTWKRAAKLYRELDNRKATEMSRYRDRLDQLYRDLLVVQERGRPCDHLTLSAPGLPCPHPECTTAEIITSIDRTESLKNMWRYSETLDRLHTVKTRQHRRDMLMVGTQKIWAWREA